FFECRNATVGGNLLTKTPRDALTTIENKSKVCNSRLKPIISKVNTNVPSSSIPHSPEIGALVDVVKAMLHQKSSPPASVKAVEEICVTSGGPHPYHQCLATDGNVFPEYRDNIQGYVSAAAISNPEASQSNLAIISHLLPLKFSNLSTRLLEAEVEEDDRSRPRFLSGNNSSGRKNS
ncbi:hypothetical protein Tco_1471822, partial [Tanacetum coccineum]